MTLVAPVALTVTLVKPVRMAMFSFSWRGPTGKHLTGLPSSGHPPALLQVWNCCEARLPLLALRRLVALVFRTGSVALPPPHFKDFFFWHPTTWEHVPFLGNALCDDSKSRRGRTLPSPVTDRPKSLW